MELEERFKNLEVWVKQTLFELKDTVSEQQDRATVEFVKQQDKQNKLHKASIRNHLILGIAEVVGLWAIVILLLKA